MIMGNKKIDYLVFAAEKREVSSFLKKAKKVNDRVFLITINNKRILLIVTGVGKNAIKRTLKNQNEFLQDIKAEKTFNLGNAGALKSIKASTILKIGKSFGNNGKEKLILDSSSHVENITVNSLQNKKKLSRQFNNAYTVDMELFHLAKAYPQIISYKIILDTFRFNPKSIIFKFILPLLAKKNNKLLYNFFISKYCS